MNITVHLHTILQRQTPEGLVGRLDISLPLASSVNDLLDYLDVDLAPENLLLVVNGCMAELTQTLQDGDEVNLMPAISGGNRFTLHVGEKPNKNKPL
jgi:molybdopterin converting factor small subunit